MPCYHPRIRIEDLKKWQTAQDGHRYHPATIEQPNDLPNRLEQLKDNLQYRYQIIPCQNCIGCRLEYSRQWATRGYLESKLWEQNWFVTITYDDENLTTYEEITTKDGFTYSDQGWNGTLVPEELTQFIKNVRQIMKRDYNQDGIRFMAAGEYGSEGLRPHYHIIFFNLNLPQESFYDPHIKNGNTYWKNIIIDRAWGYKGIENISEATWNDIAYTARYITKKINGPTSEHEYYSRGQEKEFFRVSRMPGIGEGYYKKHKEEIYRNDEVIIKNAAGVVRMQPPEYFDRLYEAENPEGFKKIKENRKKRAKNAAKIKDETTSIFRLDQLLIEERDHEEKAVKLVREFEKASK